MDFPICNDDVPLDEYIQSIDSFLFRINRHKNKIIYDFISKWIDGTDIKIISILSFKNIKNDKLPLEEHTKHIMQQYSNDTAKKLGVDFIFDENEYNKDTIIAFLRIILNEIGYKIIYRTKNKIIYWSIIRFL